MLFFILFVAGEGGGIYPKTFLSSNPELKVADYMCEKKYLPEVSIEAEPSTNQRHGQTSVYLVSFSEVEQ